MKLKDIQLKYYFNLKVTKHYDIWLDKLPARDNIFGIKSKGLDDWTFDEVAYLKRYADSDDIEKMQKEFGICFPKIYKYRFFNRFTTKRIPILTNKIRLSDVYLFQFAAWQKFIANELEKVVNLESKLVPEPDAIAIMSGIDNFEVFGDMNTIIPIAEQFGFKPNDVADWKYMEVFTLALYNKTKGEFNKRYAENKQNELKNKL